MRFGVMSDTHGNAQFASMAADRIVADGAAFIYHLGDNFADAEMLRFSGLDVRMVPGLWCREYRDPKIPNIIEDRIEGVAVACAHTLDDLRKNSIRADLYFFGHTHEAEARQWGRVLHVNPGHLKRSIDRGQPASYVVVDIDAEHIVVAIYAIEDGACARHVYERHALGG